MLPTVVDPGTCGMVMIAAIVGPLTLHIVAVTGGRWVERVISRKR